MAKIVKENLSQLVARVVREKGLSLTEVVKAAEGEITKGYVSGIIKGNVRNISLDKLIALAKGIGEDARVLFDAYYGRPPAPRAELREVTEWSAADLADVVKRLVDSPRLRDIITLADGLSVKSQTRLVESLRSLNDMGKGKADRPARKRR